MLYILKIVQIPAEHSRIVYKLLVRFLNCGGLLVHLTLKMEKS